MHRTVKVGILNGKPAEVNGTKAKSLRTGLEMLTDSKRAGQGKLPYLALDSFIWVFSATILRPLTSARNYATIADRKSANSEGLGMETMKNREKALRNKTSDN